MGSASLVKSLLIQILIFSLAKNTSKNKAKSQIMMKLGEKNNYSRALHIKQVKSNVA